MRSLILFSLKRRFINPVALSLQVLLTLALIVLFNLDRISTVLKLDLNKPFPIQVSELTQKELIQNDYWEKQGVTLSQEKAPLSIDFRNGIYEVKGAATLSLQVKIYGLLLQSHQQKLLNQSHPSVTEFIMMYNSAPVVFDAPIDPLEAIQGSIVFAILTSVYFMMLNFISVNSNEIIQEKTSNILEFILTSITPFQHFCAKILTGLITVLVQIGFSVGVFGFLLIQRLNLDHGKGLFLLANKYFNLEGTGIDFVTVFQLFKITPNFMVKIGVACVFLIIGLVILQVLILVLSARVKTIEEAASIQGPFYLGLLGLYYVSLVLNTPQQLSQGVGVVLSYLPISSMLIMGMRLFSTTVTTEELSLSLLGSVFALTLIMGIGFTWYRKGLVNE